VQGLCDNVYAEEVVWLLLIITRALFQLDPRALCFMSFGSVDSLVGCITLFMPLFNGTLCVWCTQYGRTNTLVHLLGVSLHNKAELSLSLSLAEEIKTTANAQQRYSQNNLCKNWVSL
jgi:hypothetical protein